MGCRFGTCVEINQCVGCTRQFFTKSFLGDDVAVLAPSSGEEPASPRHRAGVASMAWRSRTSSCAAPAGGRAPTGARRREPPQVARSWQLVDGVLLVVRELAQGGGGPSEGHPGHVAQQVSRRVLSKSGRGRLWLLEERPQRVFARHASPAVATTGDISDRVSSASAGSYPPRNAVAETASSGADAVSTLNGRSAGPNARSF